MASRRGQESEGCCGVPISAVAVVVESLKNGSRFAQRSCGRLTKYSTWLILHVADIVLQESWKHGPRSSSWGIFASRRLVLPSDPKLHIKTDNHPNAKPSDNAVAFTRISYTWCAPCPHRPLLRTAVPLRAPTALVTSSPATFSHLAFPSTSRASKSPILSYSL